MSYSSGFGGGGDIGFCEEGSNVVKNSTFRQKTVQKVPMKDFLPVFSSANQNDSPNNVFLMFWECSDNQLADLEK